MAASDNPVLSICIPSYNRAALLAELLREIDRPDFLPFPFEVIVSDNASPDTGYAAFASHRPAHHAYEYIRHATNIGAFRNILGLYRQARGEFCLHLADDDRLILPQVAAMVEQMQADPRILACFAPWELYDAIDDRVTVEPKFEDAVFVPGEAALMADRMSRWSLVNPENGIFRTHDLGGCLYPSPLTYYSFRLVERLLTVGAVAFKADAFYRGFRRHRDETGGRVVLSAIMGVEARTAMARSVAVFHRWATGQSLGKINPGGLGRVHLEFLSASVEQSSGQGQFLEAAEMMDYIASMTDAPPFSPETWTTTHQAAAFDGLVHAIETLPGPPRVHLAGLGALGDPLRALLTNRPAIEFAETPLFSAGAFVDDVVVTASDAMRNLLIGRSAVRPGYVFSLESAFRAFGVGS